MRAGEVDAVALVARHHPRGVPDDPGSFALAGAQLVVARAHGFPSWPRMLDYLRSARPLWRDPGALDPVSADADGGDGSDGMSIDELASAAAALACLTYTDRDDPARWARAAAILERRPELAVQDVAVAAATGDVAALRRHVAGDAGAATRETGPFRWPPLLYLVYSRVPQVDAVGSARVLLDAGADPDSGYLWQGLPTPFTALTGVFGEGEQGPGREPRHPQWRALAELLLERGADPNDRQALYNRMFNRDDSHLELLLEHGLGRPSSEIWERRTGQAAESLEEMLVRQVGWARDHGFVHRLELLAVHGLLAGPPSGPEQSDIHRAATPEAVAAAVAAGAGVDERPDGRTALHQAAFMDDVELVRALLAAGADPEARDDTHRTRPLEWARWAHARAAEQVLAEVTATDG
ncbi:hypothetical protein GCM10009858_40170 [Terrabacter carboxydivorans]|uniref:Ankyrin repeat domain-containing protein n=1 Tax=Terrabacter carboxydivorans TaxID=619730 RepID=A0ABP5ZK54_9MICO